MVPVSVLLPYEEGKLLGEIRRVGVVETEAYGDDGVLVAAHVPPPTARRLRRFGHAEAFPRDADTNENAWSAEEEAELAELMLEEEALEARTRRAS
jgi:GTP-binding protein HflX